MISYYEFYRLIFFNYIELSFKTKFLFFYKVLKALKIIKYKQ